MRWYHLFLLCVLSASCTRAEVQDVNSNVTSAESAETSSEEQTSDEITEEDNVLVLNKKNFDKALQDYPFLLVEFYAPWCGHCQELAPKYAKAAEILKNRTTHARLAKVDSTEEQDLAKEFNVNGYPTIKFFKGGNRTDNIDFGGRRDVDGIVKWMLRRLGPLATLLVDVAVAERFASANELTVIAFLQDPDDSDVKLYHEVTENAEDFNFAYTHKEDIFKKFGVTKDTVIFFKNSEEKYQYEVDEEVGLDKDELTRFLMVNSMDLVTEYNESTSERIFAAKIPNHLLLFINKTEQYQLELLENFRNAAPEYKGKLLFILVDSNGPHAGVLQYFGINSTDVPTIRLINIDLVKKYAFSEKKITTEAVKNFVDGVLAGKIKQNLLSEEIPEDWDKKPVKVLVGKNFDDIAYDETKNVFVEFYAPWCSHCKELEPIWEELAEKYKDHENVIIAKIDGTANEIDGLRVRGYPNLRFFPAGPEHKMIEYTKDRTVELFSAFIDSGGVLPKDEATEEPQGGDTKATKEQENADDGGEKAKDEL
ncbi:disulfide-isomerase A2 [Pelobates cultripes]|uniref:Protein disulfide-isomerase n=1 Tax=Pelobates cultripes TaxID=61616 RepID=A0AAD1SQJ8_PELCU|nr:disulfide-isomerase A2 [Pelobates cultripes]CAH2307776.1 disulfide-isomerase A2 [Pelobates cultripes]